MFSRPVFLPDSFPAAVSAIVLHRLRITSSTVLVSDRRNAHKTGVGGNHVHKRLVTIVTSASLQNLSELTRPTRLFL